MVGSRWIWWSKDVRVKDVVVAERSMIRQTEQRKRMCLQERHLSGQLQSMVCWLMDNEYTFPVDPSTMMMWSTDVLMMWKDCDCDLLNRPGSRRTVNIAIEKCQSWTMEWELNVKVL